MTETVVALPLHPVALLLPELPLEEQAALTASIAAVGQTIPAASWVADDDIEYLIDGRHRARACELLGLPLRVQRFEGDEAAMRAYVLATNVTRRHLTPSQRGVAASALASRGRGERGSAAGLTQGEAAKAAGVSIRLVRAARTFADDPDLTRSVLDGEITITEAERRARGARIREIARESATDEWLTPLWLVARVERLLGQIDGDPCAEPGRRVSARWHLTEEDDALSVPRWGNADGSASRIFMNPPWDRAHLFVRRLLREVDAGHVREAVVLLPARLGSEYVQSLTSRGYPRVELTGRMQYDPGRGAVLGGRGEAHFASMLIGVNVEVSAMHSEFRDVGTVLQAVVA